MVSEGFDCDRLDTLVMATPIREITQSIGRILRKKIYQLAPLIIDMQDKIGPFTSQGAYRKAQYRKQHKPDCHIEIYDKNLDDGDPTHLGDCRGGGCAHRGKKNTSPFASSRTYRHLPETGQRMFTVTYVRLPNALKDVPYQVTCDALVYVIRNVK